MNKEIKYFIEEFIKEKNISIFIETGTFFGTTSEWASPLFKVVYTIEKSTRFFRKAEKGFLIQDIHDSVKNCFQIAVTEKRTKQEIDKLIKCLKDYK